MTIFKDFDHIGIVVEDLQRAMDQLARLLGLECNEKRELKEAGIRMAFYPFGEGQMELIEFQRPIDDVDPIVLKPGGGVQHVAFRVEDFEGTIKELIDRGLKLVKGFPREGAHGMVAFFYPIEGLDLLIEICQSNDFQHEKI
jgi:methylmalonyl-CoA/ethylmalonyl-CoA epimerase